MFIGIITILIKNINIRIHLTHGELGVMCEI